MSSDLRRRYALGEIDDKEYDRLYSEERNNTMSSPVELDYFDKPIRKTLGQNPIQITETDSERETRETGEKFDEMLLGTADQFIELLQDTESFFPSTLQYFKILFEIVTDLIRNEPDKKLDLLRILFMFLLKASKFEGAKDEAEVKSAYDDSLKSFEKYTYYVEGSDSSIVELNEFEEFENFKKSGKSLKEYIETIPTGGKRIRRSRHSQLKEKTQKKSRRSQRKGKTQKKSQRSRRHRSSKK